MMSEAWREWIYPLGFLAALAFGARGLLQWVESEARGRSVSSRLFWYLSLAGNLLLFTHSFFQVQFHVCAVQACNSVISWRNLNLMGEHPLKLRSVLLLLAGSLALTAGGFLLQTEEGASWFRIPEISWLSAPGNPLSDGWHALGFLGITLFSSRFWVQWWDVERRRESRLGAAFWWMSLSGGALSLLYFSQTRDPVNLIGPAVGMVPYIRNLMLIRRAERGLS